MVRTPWNKGLRGDFRLTRYWLGRKFTAEHRAKLSEAHKGQISGNKGRKGQIPWNKGIKGQIAWNKGKKGLQIAWNKGKSCPQLMGEKHGNWKGGTVSLSARIRKSWKYRLWRSDVFTRDDFTCQECGCRGIYIHAHHIEAFSLIMELNDIKTFEQAMNCEELWNINNGITMCRRCHNSIKEEL